MEKGGCKPLFPPTPPRGLVMAVERCCQLLPKGTVGRSLSLPYPYLLVICFRWATMLTCLHEARQGAGRSLCPHCF